MYAERIGVGSLAGDSAWMFERSGFPEQARVAVTPGVEMSALSTLAELLRQALKNERNRCGGITYKFCARVETMSSVAD